LLIIAYSMMLHSQDFETRVIFKNSKGSIDTIIIGYSPDATDSLDIFLGELNLSDYEIDTNFSVYATNIVILDNGKTIKPAFRTKKQIVHFIKNEYIRYVCVDVICNDFPLTVKWDKLQFQDTSRFHSFIITAPPGSWFDAGDSPYLLSEADSVTYSYLNNYNGKFYFDSIYGKKIKIWKLYIGFASQSNLLEVKNHRNDQYSIFPNPCQNLLNVLGDSYKMAIIQIFDTNGKLLYNKRFENKLNLIDMTHFQSGFYIIKIGDNYVYKIIKQ